jgi:hypothetical protein
MLATLAGAAIAGGQPQGQMARDLATRDRDIHWPAGFEPEKADLFAHNEARLNASCERCGRLHAISQVLGERRSMGSDCQASDWWRRRTPRLRLLPLVLLRCAPYIDCQ